MPKRSGALRQHVQSPVRLVVPAPWKADPLGAECRHRAAKPILNGLRRQVPELRYARTQKLLRRARLQTIERAHLSLDETLPLLVLSGFLLI